MCPLLPSDLWAASAAGSGGGGLNADSCSRKWGGKRGAPSEMDALVIVVRWAYCRWNLVNKPQQVKPHLDEMEHYAHDLTDQRRRKYD